MKVVLVEPKSPGYNVFTGILLPRLGLPILGSILKSLGHKVKIFCEEIKSIDWGAVKQADIVGVSTITSTAPRAYEIASKSKSFGKTVVMGGPHVTFQTEEALNYSDFVVRGEGEETFPELIEVVEGKRSPEKVKGLSYKFNDKVAHNPDRPLICCLDELPFPDLSLIEGYEKINFPPSACNGCCSLHSLIGGRFGS